MKFIAKSLFTLSFILILFSNSLKGQERGLEFGGAVGVASLFGNFASQTSLAGTIIFDVHHPYFDGYNLSARFSYIQKFERFLPEDRKGRYYPFVKSLSIRVDLTQQLDETFFLEESFGLLLLNDHTFEIIKDWNYGVAFSGAIGLILSQTKAEIWKLYFGMDVGQTFNNLSTGFYSLQIEGKYYFSTE
ncbi:MAG: hypothetical protein K9J12_12565 [Melioribacteraceae bacterium]|nr:hypothetical protein [Melioribacteraceae bacterium]MCF8264165.1 hypothetical protein [Melioribacteraceae bacterium]MCF8413931.1 hypothetical protein [Melioribacteraceae bacterium]MCF8430521.1 hypothetical protein [Melioribacteraceae bacterium]